MEIATYILTVVLMSEVKLSVGVEAGVSYYAGLVERMGSCRFWIEISWEFVTDWSVLILFGSDRMMNTLSGGR